jgi:hypothetical protein
LLQRHKADIDDAYTQIDHVRLFLVGLSSTVSSPQL